MCFRRNQLHWFHNKSRFNQTIIIAKITAVKPGVTAVCFSWLLCDSTVLYHSSNSKKTIQSSAVSCQPCNGTSSNPGKNHSTTIVITKVLSKIAYLPHCLLFVFLPLYYLTDPLMPEINNNGKFGWHFLIYSINDDIPKSRFPHWDLLTAILVFDKSWSSLSRTPSFITSNKQTEQ